MKYTSFVIGCLLAVGMLTMTACGAAGNAPETTTAAAPVTALQTENEANATMAGGTVAVPESFTFERVRFEGEGHMKATLETYLAEHHENLIATMHNHGVSESEDLKILPTPIYAVDLRTGTVNLDAHYLPVMEDNAMIGAARVSAREGFSVSARTAELSWMSVVDRYLKNDPAERYLLTECYTSEGTYFCLISSKNEIIYLVRPEGGVDLPFEEGVDYYGKLYDERLFLSYGRIHTEKKPISAILMCRYNAYVASSGGNGYSFNYFTPTEIVWGYTRNTPIDLNDPLGTEGIVNQENYPNYDGEFSEICAKMQELHYELLPETVEPQDPTRIVMDGSHLYLVFYYEDGTTFTSQGYAADSYNEHFKNVYVQLAFFGAQSA